MAVTVNFHGFPEIRRATQATRFRVESDSPTLGALLEALREQGVPVGEQLLTPDGHIREAVQVIRNGDLWLPRDRSDTPLGPGDEITFLFLMAGG